MDPGLGRDEKGFRMDSGVGVQSRKQLEAPVGATNRPYTAR